MKNKKRSSNEMSKLEKDSGAKRQKQSVESDLICPITHELPFDPVHAEDGSMYERHAIEEYFATTTKSEGKVKSPTKGMMIGTSIFAAPHIKNHIERLISKDVITGDLANKWKERAKEKKYADDLIKDAENGNKIAMYNLGTRYYTGEQGFKKDRKEAYKWFKKANAAGCVEGMAMEGVCLLYGHGVKKNTAKAMLYLGMAEGQGSNYAAFKLGEYFVKEGNDLTDKVLARKMLEKVVNGNYTHKHLNAIGKKTAKAVLDKLQSSD
mmetsp:Transcript_24547/g.36375  ORF Transcript_24547/g.36375 Transcript_24547/m.36375 type:complete len:266 (+) Transcript_24547:105-902(+)